MKIGEIEKPLLEIPGYPQLRIQEPAVLRLLEIGERFDGFGLDDREAAAETICWTFSEFVRDTEGNRIEGLTKKNALDHVSIGMMKSIIEVLKGGIDGDPQD